MEEKKLLKDAMLAAYAALQNGHTQAAKELLVTGLEGGSVNNALDIQRCWNNWKFKYAKTTGHGN